MFGNLCNLHTHWILFFNFVHKFWKYLHDKSQGYNLIFCVINIDRNIIKYEQYVEPSSLFPSQHNIFFLRNEE